MSWNYIKIGIDTAIYNTNSALDGVEGLFEIDSDIGRCIKLAVYDNDVSYVPGIQLQLFRTRNGGAVAGYEEGIATLSAAILDGRDVIRRTLNAEIRNRATATQQTIRQVKDEVFRNTSGNASIYSYTTFNIKPNGGSQYSDDYAQNLYPLGYTLQIQIADPEV